MWKCRKARFLWRICVDNSEITRFLAVSRVFCVHRRDFSLGITVSEGAAGAVAPAACSLEVVA